MKNLPLPRFRSLRATLLLFAAALAFSPACYATPAQDAGELATQFERLSKAALMAARGNVQGFQQLRESREIFSGKLKALSEGSHYGLCSPLGISADTKSKLAIIAEQWAQFNRAAATMVENEQSMHQIVAAVAQINKTEAPLTELAQQVLALKLYNKRPPRDLQYSSQVMYLQLRMVKNANAVLAGDFVDPEAMFLLNRDTNTIRDITRGLQSGSDALRIEASEGEELTKLTALSTQFATDQQAVAVMYGNVRQLVTLKSAMRFIVDGGEGFFQNLLDVERQIGASSVC